MLFSTEKSLGKPFFLRVYLAATIERPCFPTGYLGVDGIGLVSCTCRHLRDAGADERLWVSLWEGPLPGGFLTGGRAAHVALWLLAKGAVEQVNLISLSAFACACFIVSVDGVLAVHAVCDYRVFARYNFWLD